MSGIIRSGGSSLVVPAEFSNVTARTFAQMQAGVALATPASDEVLRLRDVTITQTVPRPWRLRLGSLPILAGQGSTRLSGDEIVVPGAPLTLDTQVVALINRMGFVVGTVGPVHDVTIPTIFSGDRLTAFTGTSAQTSFSTSLTVTPHFACIGANGDFYYGTRAQGTQVLYRRAGGVNGAETTVAGGANFHNYCYDGSRYIYAITTSNFREIDTLTGTVSAAISLTGVTTLQLTTNWAHHAAALDRYFVIRCDGNQSPGYSVVLVNGQTGAAVNLGAPSVVSTTNRLPVALNRLSNGDYVAHVIASTNTIRINLGPNLASPVVQASGPSYATSALESSGAEASIIVGFEAARNHLVQLRNNTSGHSIVNLDTGEFVMSGLTSTPINSATPTCWFSRPLDAALAGAIFGTADARVTGERFRG